MRGSRTTSTLILAGALGLGTLVTAAPALADTPAHDGGEMVLVFGDGGSDTTGDLAPAPQPDPEPQPGPGDISDGPVDPGPDPMPEDEPEIGLPDPGDPDPHGPGDLAHPEDPSEPGPQGPGDLADGGCHATHGCQPEQPGDLADDPGNGDDCPELLGSCDLADQPTDPGDDPTGDDPADAGEPGDQPSGDDGSSSGGDAEVLGSSISRGALPHTGAGIAVLAALGTALTGVGAGLRKVARR